MEVRVIVFGQILDITGRTELVLQDIPDTDELVRQMHSRYPLLENLQYRIAVEKNIITGNTPLADQYTVALLPPFSGG